MALSLLGAIRSPSVVPQLIAIVEDDQRDVWQRSYALRSIVATSGDWFLPQLKAEMSMILQRRAAIMPNYQGHDLLDELHNLAAHHPKNREWFFSALDEATSLEVVCEFLSAAINLWQPDEFRGLLIDYLLKLLTAHPQPMDLAVIETLMLTDDAKVSAWLHQNTDKIAPDLMEISDPSSQTQVHLPDYLQSPAYRYLWDLYQHADGGDREAYHQLVQIARKWRGNIPLRAVATYLIGKLWPQYNVVSLLCDLLKYAEDSWGDDALPLTPIRFEAGEALKDRPSPQVWEEMIDAFSSTPRISFRTLCWIGLLM